MNIKFIFIHLQQNKKKKSFIKQHIKNYTMKKFLFILLCSTLTMTSCSEEEFDDPIMYNFTEKCFTKHVKVSSQEFDFSNPEANATDMTFRGAWILNPGDVQVGSISNSNKEKNFTYKVNKDEVFTIEKTGATSFNIKFSDKAYWYNNRCRYIMFFTENGNEHLNYIYQFDYDYDSNQWHASGIGIDYYGIEK